MRDLRIYYYKAASIRRVAFIKHRHTTLTSCLDAINKFKIYNQEGQNQFIIIEYFKDLTSKIIKIV